MKATLIVYLAIGMLSLMAAVADTPLEWYAAHLDQMKKVTMNPLKMNESVAMLCVNVGPVAKPSIHSDKFFDIYISEAGLPFMIAGVGIYPTDTVILKRKYSDAEGKKTELYTGMIKRKLGYNPQGGDWEYFVISGDGKTVTQQGKLASCMSCHQAYEQSDYVTREYLDKPKFFHSGDNQN